MNTLLSLSVMAGLGYFLYVVGRMVDERRRQVDARLDAIERKLNLVMEAQAEATSVAMRTRELLAELVGKQRDEIFLAKVNETLRDA